MKKIKQKKQQQLHYWLRSYSSCRANQKETFFNFHASRIPQISQKLSSTENAKIELRNFINWQTPNLISSAHEEQQGNRPRSPSRFCKEEIANH